jgi:hypothetical protein
VIALALSTPPAIAAHPGAVVPGDSVQLPSERTEVTLAPEALSAFVGTYELQPGAVMYVRLEGSSLTVQIVGQPRLPLFAESPTRFFLRVVDAQVDFVRDGAGRVTHLVLHQNGASREWKKTSATAPAVPAPRTAVTVAPEILARYTGVYELKPGFDLTIAVAPGGGLTGQATSQGAFPLLAESPTRRPPARKCGAVGVSSSRTSFSLRRFRRQRGALGRLCHCALHRRRASRNSVPRERCGTARLAAGPAADAAAPALAHFPGKYLKTQLMVQQNPG